MEGSLLGAVGATRVLLSAHPTWDGGEVAPRNHRLNLEKEEEEEEGGNGKGWVGKRQDDGKMEVAMWK